MNKLSTAAISLATLLALSAAPLASASAREWDHHGGGRGGGHWEHGGGHGNWGHHDHDGWGYFGFGALFGAAAAVATAPFVFAGPAPVAVAPAPYYAPAYNPHRVVYAAPAPAYAYPAPYYGVPAGYYAGY